MVHTEDLSPNVERGAALLDREMPGWREFVDTHVLDLDDPLWCVLGQVSGGFLEGLTELGLRGRSSHYDKRVRPLKARKPTRSRVG
jgi:hypothetical protein